MGTTRSLTVGLPEHIHGVNYSQGGFSTTDATGTGVSLVDALANLKGVILDLIVSASGGANTVSIVDGVGTIVPAINIPATTCELIVVRPIRASAANSALTLVASAATALTVSYHYCYEPNS